MILFCCYNARVPLVYSPFSFDAGFGEHLVSCARPFVGPNQPSNGEFTAANEDYGKKPRSNVTYFLVRPEYGSNYSPHKPLS